MPNEESEETYNVLLSVSYDTEAGSEREAKNKAGDKLDRDINYSDADPSDVITARGAVKDQGVDSREVVREIMETVEGRFETYFDDPHADWMDESEAVVNEVIRDKEILDELSEEKKERLDKLAFNYAHLVSQKVA